ncbi:MAG TPA: SDR family oxidoreductase [Nevskia sp.]|nr:SDR family oxidoreductase [Nevskia sp.]
MTFPYRTALVTGASSGIGENFAEALAARGCDLVLVARSRDKLQALAQRLSQAHGRRVEVLAADLATLSPGAGLKKAADKLGLHIDLLINNAGFGTKGRFETLDPQREQQELLLNAGAVVDLSHSFLPGMLEAGHGAIVNLASMAAFQPLPYMAVYGASKVFVWSFTDALWAETRGRGVHVMAVCPGPVETPFFEATGAPGLRETVPNVSVVSPQLVVNEALKGLLARKRLVVPGTLSHAGSLFTRLAPRPLLARAVEKFMKP